MWKSLFPINSVKEENIHILTNERLLIPGPGIVDTAEIFKEIVRAENE